MPHGRGQINLPQAVHLLPTPTAQAAKHGSTPDIHAHGYGSNLWDLPNLLPTPTVVDMGSKLDAGSDQPAADHKVAGISDRSSINWGKYEQAVRRWEAITRPAPSPTFSGSDGRPRLSPLFVEWMMGLPVGHVTGHGLSVTQELKMLGNGVCPQQARLALQMLGAEMLIMDGGHGAS